MKKIDLQRKKLIESLRKGGMTFKDIGKICNVSKQRAHQLYSLKYVNKKSKWDAETKKIYTREKHQENRLNAVMALGGKCVKCGMNDYRCLQIDHINGGGSKEVREISSYSRYKWIVDNIEEAKNKYQILCANHNWIKRFENGEVHRH